MAERELRSNDISIFCFKIPLIPPGDLRIVLALSVVFSHLTRFDVGRIAVLLFFYLSGYWTLRIWREKFADGATARFLVGRYLRIAPLYLLTMLAAAWLQDQPVGLNNLALIGVASGNRDPTGVAWSLDIELQYYIIAPVLFAAIEKMPAYLLALSLALAAIVWGLDYHTVTVLNYLPVFILGGLTYHTHYSPSQLTAARSLAIFSLLTVVVAFTPFFDKTIDDPFDRDLFAFFWMLPLLPYVARSLRRKSTRLDRHIGNFSYPLYLVHYTAIGLLAADGMASKLLAVALAFGVALGLYVVIDRPIDRWRTRVTERTSGSPDAGRQRNGRLRERVLEPQS